MKKTIIIFLGLMMIFGIVGCKKKNKNNDDPNPNPSGETYTVTWKNYDGTVLETDTGVAKDAMPHYDGTTPLKKEDSEYIYTFDSWSPALSPVIADITYTATFNQTKKGTNIKQYIITWKNYNGSTLSIDQVNEGVIPTFDVELNGEPTRAEDDDYTYTWSGWNPTPAAAYSNATYTATFTPKSKTSQGGSQGGNSENGSTSRFVDKKIVTTKIETTHPASATLIPLYESLYVVLFDDSTFEIIIKSASYLEAILGTYEVADNDLSVDLTATKLYDNKDGYTTTIPDQYQDLSITYSNDTYNLVIDMDNYPINFTLDASSTKPMHYDLPNDPNAHGDPRYHVSENKWNEIMFNNGLLSGSYKFTLSYPALYGMYSSDNYTLKVDGRKIEQVNSPYSVFFNYTSDNSGKCYYYDDVSSLSWKENDVVANIYESFENCMGTIPIPFVNMSFADSSDYYYLSSFRHYPDKENYPTIYTDYTNIRVYFDNNQLLKITYTAYGNKCEYIYTNIGTTVVTLPKVTGGVDNSNYVDELKNTVFTFDNISGNMSYQEKTAYNESVLSLFDDLSAEYSLSYFYDGKEVQNQSSVLFGKFSIKENSFNVNNGNPYILGNLVFDHHLTESYEEVEMDMLFAYFIKTKEIRLHLSSSTYAWYNFEKGRIPMHTDISTLDSQPSWVSETIQEIIGEYNIPDLYFDGIISYSVTKDDVAAILTINYQNLEEDEAIASIELALTNNSFTKTNDDPLTYSNSTISIEFVNTSSSSLQIAIYLNDGNDSLGYPDNVKKVIDDFFDTYHFTDKSPEFLYENAKYNAYVVASNTLAIEVSFEDNTDINTVFVYFKTLMTGFEDWSYVADAGSAVYVSPNGQYAVFMKTADVKITIAISPTEDL